MANSESRCTGLLHDLDEMTREVGLGVRIGYRMILKNDKDSRLHSENWILFNINVRPEI